MCDHCQSTGRPVVLQCYLCSDRAQDGAIIPKKLCVLCNFVLHSATGTLSKFQYHMQRSQALNNMCSECRKKPSTSYCSACLAVLCEQCSCADHMAAAVDGVTKDEEDEESGQRVPLFHDITLEAKELRSWLTPYGGNGDSTSSSSRCVSPYVRQQQQPSPAFYHGTNGAAAAAQSPRSPAGLSFTSAVFSPAPFYVPSLSPMTPPPPVAATKSMEEKTAAAVATVTAATSTSNCSQVTGTVFVCATTTGNVGRGDVVPAAAATQVNQTTTTLEISMVEKKSEAAVVSAGQKVEVKTSSSAVSTTSSQKVVETKTLVAPVAAVVSAVTMHVCIAFNDYLSDVGCTNGPKCSKPHACFICYASHAAYACPLLNYTSKDDDAFLERPCVYGFTCQEGIKCRYHHSYLERLAFLWSPTGKGAPLAMTSMCRYDDRCRRFQGSQPCNYAHNIQDVVCQLCHQKGHENRHGCLRLAAIRATSLRVGSSAGSSA
jgi:hypothetical protein